MEWTGQIYAETPTVAAHVYVDAPPERVWAYVSDIHLMPKLSSELQDVEWLAGASGPAPGNRFVGRSTHESVGSWETVSTIVDYDAPERFTWAVGDLLFPSSLWRFTVAPQADGTVREQWAQMGPATGSTSPPPRNSPSSATRPRWRAAERPACGSSQAPGF